MRLSTKTGRRKLGRIYAQLVQKRLGRVSVLSLFSKLSSTFVRYIFLSGYDFNVSDFKYVQTTDPYGPYDFNVSSVKTVKVETSPITNHLSHVCFS